MPFRASLVRAIKWLICQILIKPTIVTIECFLTKYSLILIFICGDKSKHLTSNLDMINNGIASNKVLIWCIVGTTLVHILALLSFSQVPNMVVVTITL